MCIYLFHTLLILNPTFKSVSIVKSLPFLVSTERMKPYLYTQESHFDLFPRGTTSFLRPAVFSLKIFKILLCLKTIHMNDVIFCYLL